MLCSSFVQYSKFAHLLHLSQSLCLFYHIVKKKAIYLSFDIYCNIDEFCLYKLSIFIQCESVTKYSGCRFLCTFSIWRHLCTLYNYFLLLFAIIARQLLALLDLSCHISDPTPSCHHPAPPRICGRSEILPTGKNQPIFHYFHPSAIHQI